MLDEEEASYLRRIRSTYAQYERSCMEQLNSKRRSIDKLLLGKNYEGSVAASGLVRKSFEVKASLYEQCARINQEFFNKLIPSHICGPEEEEVPEDEVNSIFSSVSKATRLLSNSINAAKITPSGKEIGKVRSILRHLQRDWSKEGTTEREQCYTPILDYVKEHFSNSQSRPSVLVPGAGLGRLAYELACTGIFSKVEANEVSFYMLLCSYYILNTAPSSTGDTPVTRIIYPHIHSWSNHTSVENQFRPVEVPDLIPSPDQIPPYTEFSMMAGDFIDLYTSQHQEFDCIVTCFFIDTAHNLLEYIQTIHNCLRPGGVWINMGPLLYHYEDLEGELSIELTLEEVYKVIESFQDFKIKLKQFKTCQYTSNQPSTSETISMYNYEYNCAFFIVAKNQ
ncbi:hypothetical protein MP638_006876 [Amoeboaphelidium occidentale]|nr:hypothetical protein MP638_006876 [Amoeboaphelidium occidentale]